MIVIVLLITLGFVLLHLGYLIGNHGLTQARVRAEIQGRVSGYTQAVHDCAADLIKRDKSVIAQMTADDCKRWGKLLTSKHLGNHGGKPS